MVSAEKILAYIERNGLTDADFERMCGLFNGAVCTWRKGEIKPGLKSLERIAEHTKIPLQRWLDDKD